MPSNSPANPEGREFDGIGNFLFLRAIKNGGITMACIIINLIKLKS